MTDRVYGAGEETTFNTSTQIRGPLIAGRTISGRQIFQSRA